MTHFYRFEIGEQVKLLSGQHIATVIDRRNGKYRLRVPGWIAMVRDGKGGEREAEYWYTAEHISPLLPTPEPQRVREGKSTPENNPAKVSRRAHKKPVTIAPSTEQTKTLLSDWASRREYEPVSKTDETCQHCRGGFMSHVNGRCSS